MSFWTNPLKATKSFFGTKQPPRLQSQASNPIANKMPPINFTSVFDELSKDKLDIIRGLDGKMALKFSNSDSRIDLSSLVRSGNINTKLQAINPLDERAAGVVALSQAMGRLTASIEEMEKTSPYLIEQNQDLINSFREASTKAIDRGFDSRQYAIDQKLAKMGLGESSTAFGVQVALAREKSNSYSELELKQAELAQGLKQQSLSNLHQRGDMIGKNAGIELEKFNSESRNHLANEQLRQQQAIAEKEFEFKNEEQRLGTEFANRNMSEQRRRHMAELGVSMMSGGNQQAISAQQTDNNSVHMQNNDQLNRFKNMNTPLEHKIGRQLLGNLVGSATSAATGGVSNLFNTNPWNNSNNTASSN
jgi:hypothetical protein|tara:strand:+ start:305 stop:1393 length:1089 start_codon:yes stop_codon:yes gene_type:complete